MARYVGGRIVPTHGGVWDGSKSYEELTIVLREDTGDSYISKRPVPAGTAITEEHYWVLYSVYNEQITRAEQHLDSTASAIRSEMDQQTKTVTERMEQAEDTTDKRAAAAEKVSNNNKAEITARMGQIEARQEANVRASTDASADYAAEVVDARVDGNGITYQSLGMMARNTARSLEEAIARVMVTPRDTTFFNQEVLFERMLIAYTATKTSSWQHAETFNDIPMGPGERFTLNVSYANALGTMPFMIYYVDAEGNDIDRSLTNMDENGRVSKEYKTPEGTDHLRLVVNLISNAQTAGEEVIVGEVYYAIGVSITKGEIVADKRILVSNQNLGPSARRYVLGLRNATKLPNYNTQDMTLTLYPGTVLIDPVTGQEIIRTEEEIVLPRDGHSQINLFYFDTESNEFGLLYARSLSDTHILLGYLNGATGIGQLMTPYTIDAQIEPEPEPEPEQEYELPAKWTAAIPTIREMQGKKFCFAIQTDTHYYSGKGQDYANNLNRLTRAIAFDFVANLGDVIQGYAGDYDRIDLTRESMTEIMERYVDGIRCPFFVTIGNHETNQMNYAVHPEDGTIHPDELYARLIAPARNTMKSPVFDGRSAYYYQDFQDAGIRVIVLNTTDGVPKEDGSGLDSNFKISDTQYAWLTTKALDTDLAVVVMSHCPLIAGWSDGNNATQSLKNAMAAIVAFKEAGGTVAGCYFGHTHKQESQMHNGIPVLTFRNGDMAEAVFIDMDSRKIETLPIGFSGASREFTF